jgi:hypothetical protein
VNEALRQRLLRALDTLPDEKGWQVLDYLEFLESRYAERARPTNLFARLSETVEDTMRAARLPAAAISNTAGLVDGAGKLMRGLAAAGEAVVEEALRAAQSAPPPPGTTPPPGTPPAIPPAPDTR